MSENDIVTEPEQVNDDDLAALLAKREHARPNRLTWVLLIVLVLVVGFIGGAFANQKFGNSSSASVGAGGFPTSLPAGFPAGGFPAGGFPGSGQSGTGSSPANTGGLANLTIGTVKLVDGTNLYLTTTTGETVKVKVPDAAKVTTQQEVALTDLPSGATVVVRGDKADDGTLTATSVSEGALPGAPTGTTDSAAQPNPSAQPTSQGAN